MKSIGPQPHPVTLAAAIPAVALVLVLAATSARRVDTAGHAANAAAIATPTVAAAAEDHGAAIRPFRVSVPEAALVDLRRRIAATRWPERETVADASQGVPLAAIQDLARYQAVDFGDELRERIQALLARRQSYSVAQ